MRLLQLKQRAILSAHQPVDMNDLGPAIPVILEKHYGPPPGGWTHQHLLVSIARLGGFLARKNDGPPGWQTIWRGWQNLMLLLEGYELAKG